MPTLVLYADLSCQAWIAEEGQRRPAAWNRSQAPAGSTENAMGQAQFLRSVGSAVVSQPGLSRVCAESGRRSELEDLRTQVHFRNESAGNGQGSRSTGRLLSCHKLFD